ncbi:hypothetical protein P7K49_027510 [Saguinus oedipus]|uniref:Uncharacterized protein n=1 Tax=Saguinus oedipus TaxID=9490 RepID=A0ABQ9UBS8_SAGOE|nr:hypothetical protein P7K49_027510 [Saguinus oedipus]
MHKAENDEQKNGHENQGLEAGKWEVCSREGEQSVYLAGAEICIEKWQEVIGSNEEEFDPYAVAGTRALVATSCLLGTEQS